MQCDDVNVDVLQDRLEEAENWFQRAKQLDENDSSVYQHYGKRQFTHNASRKLSMVFDGTCTCINIHVRSYPWLTWYLSIGGDTGQFLGEIGRHVEAAEHYARASALAPADFELVFNTANAMRQAGACVTRYHHVILNFSKQK